MTEEGQKSVRVCGTACHYARRATCNCWCQGLFHGKAGAAARKAFRDAFGFIPTQERNEPSFHRAMQAAKDAARAGS